VTDPTGVAVDLTGATVYFTVKISISDTNSIVQKKSTNPAEILINAPRAGQAQIFLGPSDTQNLDINEYVYDVWVILASGARYPVIPPSILEVEAGVTRIP